MGIDVRAQMDRHQSVSVEIVTLPTKHRKLNCSVASARMEDHVPQMMLVTWSVVVDKTLKELTAMNMFQEAEYIPIPIQVQLFLHSLSSSASSSELDYTSFSKRSNCKFK